MPKIAKRFNKLSIYVGNISIYLNETTCRPKRKMWNEKVEWPHHLRLKGSLFNKTLCRLAATKKHIMFNLLNTLVHVFILHFMLFN